MDQVDEIACNSTDDCDELCGEYKHFCPMWTEHEGEVIDDES